jgi:hypothetical protein
MARTAKRPTAALALLATLPALAACATAPVPSSGVSASDGLPTFVWPQPRMRAPSTERPAWLAPLPAQPQRLPAPDYGFRA